MAGLVQGEMKGSRSGNWSRLVIKARKQAMSVCHCEYIIVPCPVAPGHSNGTLRVNHVYTSYTSKALPFLDMNSDSMNLDTGAELTQISNIYAVRFSPYRVETYEAAHVSYPGRRIEAEA
jgi:hypothetical protein